MRWRLQIQLPGVNHTLRADQNTVGIKEIDVAANLPVLIGIQEAINDRLLICHHIDQIIRPVRKEQVNRVILIDVENTERVQPCISRDGVCADIGDRPADIQSCLGPAVSDNLRTGLCHGKWRKYQLDGNRDDCHHSENGMFPPITHSLRSVLRYLSLTLVSLRVSHCFLRLLKLLLQTLQTNHVNQINAAPIKLYKHGVALFIRCLVDDVCIDLC